MFWLELELKSHTAINAKSYVIHLFIFFHTEGVLSLRLYASSFFVSLMLNCPIRVGYSVYIDIACVKRALHGGQVWMVLNDQV